MDDKSTMTSQSHSEVNPQGHCNTSNDCDVIDEHPFWLGILGGYIRGPDFMWIEPTTRARKTMSHPDKVDMWALNRFLTPSFSIQPYVQLKQKVEHWPLNEIRLIKFCLICSIICFTFSFWNSRWSKSKSSDYNLVEVGDVVSARRRVMTVLRRRLWSAAYKGGISPPPEKKKYGTLHDFACHPCAGAMLIFSVSFQF